MRRATIILPKGVFTHAAIPALSFQTGGLPPPGPPFFDSPKSKRVESNTEKELQEKGAPPPVAPFSRRSWGGKKKSIFLPPSASGARPPPRENRRGGGGQEGLKRFGKPAETAGETPDARPDPASETLSGKPRPSQPGPRSKFPTRAGEAGQGRSHHGRAPRKVTCGSRFASGACAAPTELPGPPQPLLLARTLGPSPLPPRPVPDRARESTKQPLPGTSPCSPSWLFPAPPSPRRPLFPAPPTAGRLFPAPPCTVRTPALPSVAAFSQQGQRSAGVVPPFLSPFLQPGRLFSSFSNFWLLHCRLEREKVHSQQREREAGSE